MCKCRLFVVAVVVKLQTKMSNENANFTKCVENYIKIHSNQIWALISIMDMGVSKFRIQFLVFSFQKEKDKTFTVRKFKIIKKKILELRIFFNSEIKLQL